MVPMMALKKEHHLDYLMNVEMAEWMAIQCHL